jgi:hypothetical protein
MRVGRKSARRGSGRRRARGKIIEQIGLQPE